MPCEEQLSGSADRLIRRSTFFLGEARGVKGNNEASLPTVVKGMTNPAQCRCALQGHTRTRFIPAGGATPPDLGKWSTTRR